VGLIHLLFDAALLADSMIHLLRANLHVVEMRLGQLVFVVNY
jgi:hypothetical protein